MNRMYCAKTFSGEDITFLLNTITIYDCTTCWTRP